MKLCATQLTPKQFEPYGQVLMAEGEVPERKPWAARIDNKRQGAQANVTFMSLAPENFPVQITELERHRYSHQLFVPLEATTHLVVVCRSLADGSPDLSAMQAFIAAEGQSVNYNANIWHAPRMVLEKPGSFVMMRWDANTDEDTELITLETPIVVAAPAP